MFSRITELALGVGGALDLRRCDRKKKKTKTEKGKQTNRRYGIPAK